MMSNKEAVLLRLWAEELNLQLRDIVYDWFLDGKNLLSQGEILKDMDSNLMYITMEAERHRDKEVLDGYKALLQEYEAILKSME